MLWSCRLLRLRRFAQKKGVWNFQALKIPAFVDTGEFQTPFFGQSGAAHKKFIDAFYPAGPILKR